jgi:acyl-CoA thioesterase
MATDKVDDEFVLSSPSGRGYRQPDPPDEVAFATSIRQEFLQYIKEKRNTLFTYDKFWEFKFYLE